MTENPILLMDLENPSHRLSIQWISEDSIPESINSEQGFHIYHVRMLTELILRQLSDTVPRYSLSEEEIRNIAMASSLHDIGKIRIPKSILNSPRRLSSVEYDIVKKHAAFGAELIQEADWGDIAPKIIQYAIEIAQNHHERIDGTGYPSGKREEDIPLCAQVVALADAYDALTSQRKYKQAYSLDVAVQMISSGMCGVFSETLLSCLMQVVNHTSLVSLRENFSKMGTVAATTDSTAPKCVLCIGNTEYITQEFVKKAFPESKVILFGNTTTASSGHIKVFRIKNPTIQDAFDTYDFDAVVYFAKELSFQKHQQSDAEQLREVLSCAAAAKRQIRFIYLSSLESKLNLPQGSSILSESKENLCDFYNIHSSLDIKIVQIPYLYSASCKKDFLFQLFHDLEQKKTVQLDMAASAPLYFLSMPDLANLLLHLFDNWRSGGGILTVGDEFHLTFADFASAIASLTQKTVTFTDKEPYSFTSINNSVLRNQYGWFAAISLLEDLPAQYENFLAITKQKKLTLSQRVKQFLEKHSTLFKIAELGILFLVTELLLQLTDSAIFFSVVDFRMAYIVIMALTHGISYGLAAATLSSISWTAAKILSGTNLLTIFYEPTNWLSFIYFFLIAALCGYVKIRLTDQIRFTKEENRLLEEKLTFTRELYNDTYKEKRDLKKQIIGSKDSFGKIYDITRKLNEEEPHRLYLRVIETFESVLENKSVAVYSISPTRTFGRLEVASRDILDNVSRSISLETYAPVIRELEQENIWKNTILLPDMPMYAAGIRGEEQLTLLIFIWHAKPEQQALYYVNLFKILRDLVQMSLLRAYKYKEAMYTQTYIPDTTIMTQEAFLQSLMNCRELAEQKISSFVLLKIDTQGEALHVIYEKLRGVVRSNDLLGLNEDGELCLLLTQVTPDSLTFVLPRLENAGVCAEVLE